MIADNCISIDRCHCWRGRGGSKGSISLLHKSMIQLEVHLTEEGLYFINCLKNIFLIHEGEAHVAQEGQYLKPIISHNFTSEMILLCSRGSNWGSFYLLHQLIISRYNGAALMKSVLQALHFNQSEKHSCQHFSLMFLFTHLFLSLLVSQVYKSNVELVFYLTRWPHSLS